MKAFLFLAKPRRAQQGVALVITLILLSVIAFMAIAFLVISRADKGSVTSSTDQALARLAADDALESAQAQLVAPVMAFKNEFDYDLVVSTNYISASGFNNNATPAIYRNPTNVSYSYPNGTPLAGNDALQNLANLLFLPRVPVYITNRAAGRTDFRYFYDANRNGLFEGTGYQIVTNSLGLPIQDQLSQLFITNYFIGDPQWVGVLTFPDRPHSADNKFLSRFAYYAVPISKALDINYMHNLANVANGSGNAFASFGTDFRRNQGVGTWELNLGSFLYDLNTNIYAWGGQYAYDPFNNYIAGAAYADAGSILTQRYAGTPLTLNTVAASYQNGRAAFTSDGMDGYTAGPLMVTNWAPLPDPDAPNRTLRPWSGSDNTNHYFTPQELFDASKSSYDFVRRLTNAIGGSLSSYDRYTFFRLLSQLGTDSVPEPPGKINLNYDNMVQRNALGIASVTNFYPWQPGAFFTKVADKLLANAGYTFSTANIQVYPTNFYTPSVHRLFQLAANIYDATTNRSFTVRTVQPMNGFPSVFRPVFMTTRTNGLQVFIVGYTNLENADIVLNPPLTHDLSVSNANLVVGPLDMIYGIPLIIGARKGFPNFNEFEMVTGVQVTRKLEFIRKDLNSAKTFPDETNQMYVVGISNTFGVEAWNSYSNLYPRNLSMLMASDIRAYLTNDTGKVLVLNTALPANPVNNFYQSNFWGTANPNKGVGGPWLGYTTPNDYWTYPQSFKLPLYTNWWHLTNAQFWQGTGPAQEMFIKLQENSALFEKHPEAPFHVPRWWLNVRTRVQFALVDTDVVPNRIVDYVSLAAVENPVDITAYLTQNNDYSVTYGTNMAYFPDGRPGSMWATNRNAQGSIDERIATFGIRNQIAASLDPRQVPNVDWSATSGAAPAGVARDGAIAFFRTNFAKMPPFAPYGGTSLFLTNRFFAPFVPTRSVYFYTSWQANDPLVHYTVGDLVNQKILHRVDFSTNSHALTIANLRKLNTRYEPWGGGSGNPAVADVTTSVNLALKDPLVTCSDDWDFPTNKFPNVGWLGRVHRGTPWQTIYLKSPAIDYKPSAQDTWTKWTGNFLYFTNFGQVSRGLVPLTNGFYDAAFSLPTNDWHLVDLFSTAFNDNAGQGKMSVNQPGLAAWSATLAGVITLTNAWSDNDLVNYPFLPPRFAPYIVPPAGPYDLSNSNIPLPSLVRIVNAINDVRATNNPTRKAFARVGDILAVPELTVNSPFLNGTTDTLRKLGISDNVYERIPQQVLGLLKCDTTPRFVIYSIGQALKPAEKSIVTGGPFFGLCTNYQVTAEVATRAVVRIEGAPDHPHAVIETFNVLPPD